MKFARFNVNVMWAVVYPCLWYIGKPTDQLADLKKLDDVNRNFVLMVEAVKPLGQLIIGLVYHRCW